jgi:hypothetical protein
VGILFEGKNNLQVELRLVATLLAELINGMINGLGPEFVVFEVGKLDEAPALKADINCVE